MSLLPSPEDGRRTSFRNVVILYYILIFYPDDGQSPENNWFSIAIAFTNLAENVEIETSFR
jgi:hypothetical protein